MLVFLLILLVLALAGFTYYAAYQHYIKLPFSVPGITSDNTTKTTQSPGAPPKIVAESVKIQGTPFLDGFIVNWTTDKNASSQVEYGPKGSFTGKTEIEKDATTNQILYPILHAVIVKGLNKNTEYQYRVISKSVDGVEAMSDTNYVTTASD